MKVIRFIFALVMTASCSYREAGIQNGDLVFVGLPGDYKAQGISEAIAEATGDGDVNYIHTAILEVSDGSVFIIDATTTRGVSRYPLHEFIDSFRLLDGQEAVFDVMRLRDNRGAEEFVKNAKSFIGECYDNAFYPDNKMHYCTELVYDSYIRNGEHLFDSVPMNFKAQDGTYPEYWVSSFEAMGLPIPQDVPGTNPQDMHSAECLVKVDVDLRSL